MSNSNNEPNLKADATSIFLQTLDACRVDAAMQRSVSCEGDALRIGLREYPLQSFSEMIVIALGKAGAAMFDAFDALLPESLACRAVVSAPQPPLRVRAGVEFFAGGHPEPNAASLEAARAALALLRQSDPRALVIFLVSGGASSMFELPRAPAITLDDLIQMNRALLGCGAPIHDVNIVRKHLSLVKGGHLALAAAGRTHVTLLVSDVPHGQLDALASGPTLPDSSTIADFRAVLDRYLLRTSLPSSVLNAIDAGLEETPKADHPAFPDACVHVLVDNAAALQHAAALASARGFVVFADNTCDDWPYENAAQHLYDEALRLKQRTPRGCLLSGGEVTVRLPAAAGVGGRNQQFALHAALLPGFASSGLTVLSAGTDGIDGTSKAAGAIVDASTMAAAAVRGIHLALSLAAFDAFPALDALGATIVTGSTGNNLRDLRLLLWDNTDPSLSAMI